MVIKGGKVRRRTWKFEGKRRESWGWTLEVNGRQVRKQGWESKAEAEDALDAYREELKNPPAPARVELTLAEAFERYFEAKARKRSLFADRQLSKQLTAEFGGDTPLSALTSDRIAQYKAKRLAAVRKIGETERRLSTSTINRPLALLRCLLHMAHEEWGVLAELPKVRLEKEPQGRLRWLTQAEATRLLDACRKSRNGALADLVEFSLFTGVRRGEALGLTWDRVDRARGVIRLEITKSGQRREVPLSSNADAVLARRWSDGATGYVFGTSNWDSFRTAWETAAAGAGLDGFRFHDLRHTFASWLVQRGRTLKEVQEALGHNTITMTMRYSHLAPDHLRAAVAVLDGVLSAAPAAPLRVEQVAEAAR
jgi:integrase